MKWHTTPTDPPHSTHPPRGPVQWAVRVLDNEELGAQQTQQQPQQATVR